MHLKKIICKFLADPLTYLPAGAALQAAPAPGKNKKQYGLMRNRGGAVRF